MLNFFQKKENLQGSPPQFFAQDLTLKESSKIRIPKTIS